MKKPLITVIIPSYNHGRFIAHTIDSILKQTLQDFEVIIIDDHSPDNSVEVIKKFQDPRIKLITLPNNMGICRVSNICFSQAQGEFLTIIASDDIMLPHNLEKKVEFLQKNPSYGAVFSQVEAIDENNKALPKKTHKYEGIFISEPKKRTAWLNHFFYIGNCLAAPTFLTRTDCIKQIKGFDELIWQAHDFDMWIKICLSGYELFVLNEKLVQYRHNTANSNLSYNDENVRKRLVFDNEKILENYLSIKNIDELVEIFPALKESREKITADLAGFFIANEAWKVGTASHKQFALNTIYKMMQDEKVRLDLENKFGFTNKDLAILTTDNPLGNIIEIMNRKPLHRIFFRKIAQLFRL